MQSSGLKAHWDKIYADKGEFGVSWFQQDPTPSLEMMEAIGADPSKSVIDIGGGASRLVDCLLDKGFSHLAVLDLSQAALAAARARLGPRARKIQWIVADVTRWSPSERYDIWHDRATFHFLNTREEQDAYVERLKQALNPGGHAIIATFAPGGPEKCSGLPVTRHDWKSLAALLGPEFQLVAHRDDIHLTPSHKAQKFQFSVFARRV